jgi:hypothetical protein
MSTAERVPAIRTIDEWKGGDRTGNGEVSASYSVPTEKTCKRGDSSVMIGLWKYRPRLTTVAGDRISPLWFESMVTANTAAERTTNRLWPTAPPDHVPILSVYDESRKEEDQYKWIESEKVGYDLGELAVRRWMREHWNGYLRARWLEHLQGKCFWIELDRGDFGLLLSQFQDHADILTPILERLKHGHENLNILVWATSNGLPRETVLTILEALDINSRRLIHRFEMH